MFLNNNNYIGKMSYVQIGRCSVCYQWFFICLSVLGSISLKTLAERSRSAAAKLGSTTCVKGEMLETYDTSSKGQFKDS